MKAYVNYIMIFIFLCVEVFCPGQTVQKNQVRQPVVAGSFYPSNVQNLKSQLDQFFNNAEDKTVNKNIAAIIVPHAGYVFSGQVAASAYIKIDPDKSFSRVFIIGTSHHVLINGASVYNRGDYETPLGKVSVDIELANRLINQNKLISYIPGAHDKEHSIEVQLPFLQYRLKKPFKIVPIIIGSQSTEILKQLAEILRPYFTPENLFVISSDFSHYPSYENAVKTDQITGSAIVGNTPEKFMESLHGNEKRNIPGLATSCCSWSSVLTLLNITSAEKNIRVTHIKYMNSGDTPYGDKNRVVGYHSFIFTREDNTKTSGEFLLTPDDKRMLLKIARESIEMVLKNKTLPYISEKDLSQHVKMKCGAFVTLNINGQLRGCIGNFTTGEPLYKVVQEMAVAAAFRDIRFMPVVKEELSFIDIEISVLTPLKKIYSIDDFKLGIQGIYMIKGTQSGTFLPQVALSTQWSKEEFLGHCARDKAGIGWDGWKGADLYTYETLVFDEKELLSNQK
jgi:AmmeMemoRadiSam system protein B/AmmeMemoRadiSam system protein A